MSKKIVSLCLTALLLFSAVLPAFAAAEAVQNTFVAENYNSANIPDNVTPDIAWDKVEKALISAVKAQEPSVDISGFNIPGKYENQQYINNMIMETPDLLRVVSQFVISIDPVENKLLEIYFAHETESYYTIGLGEYNDHVDKCKDAIETLLFGVKDNNTLSVDEKCLILHDRLAAWCEYDISSYFDEKTSLDSYSAYGALVLHKATCQGYAFAYQWLLDEIGVESCYISSKQLDHGWNMITIGDENYFVDITSDDPLWDKKGKVTHNFFLITFDTYSSMQKNKQDFPRTPQDDTYEKKYKWLTDVDSQLVYLNGYYYYFQKAADDKCILIKRTSGGVEYRLKTIEARWFISETQYYNGLCRLAQYGDKLLYSTPTQIRIYDPATGNDEVFYEPELDTYQFIYGFTQYEGVLSVQLAYTLNFDETSKKAKEKSTTVTLTICEHEDTEIIEDLGESIVGYKTAIHQCKTCSTVFTKKELTHEHDYAFKDVKSAATCVANEFQNFECKVCHNIEVREVPNTVDSDNHIGGTHIEGAVKATCSQKGYTGDVVCNTCYHKISGGSTIQETDHDYSVVVNVVKKATCVDNEIADLKCANCDAVMKNTIINDSKDYSNHVGNRVVTKEATSPTCTKAGRTEEISCDACNGVITASKKISKLGHKDSDKNGFCDVCGAEIKNSSSSFLDTIKDFFNKIIEFFKNLFKF